MQVPGEEEEEEEHEDRLTHADDSKNKTEA